MSLRHSRVGSWSGVIVIECKVKPLKQQKDVNAELHQGVQARNRCSNSNFSQQRSLKLWKWQRDKVLQRHSPECPDRPPVHVEPPRDLGSIYCEHDLIWWSCHGSNQAVRGVTFFQNTENRGCQLYLHSDNWPAIKHIIIKILLYGNDSTFVPMQFFKKKNLHLQLKLPPEETRRRNYNRQRVGHLGSV